MLAGSTHLSFFDMPIVLYNKSLSFSDLASDNTL